MTRGFQFVASLCLVSFCSALHAQQKPDTAQALAAASDSAPKKPISAHDRVEAEKRFLEGAKELERGNLKAAETDFARAVELDPGNQQYQASQEIALEHEATAMIQAADKARILGHTEEARADLIEASRLDPKNPMLAQHMDQIVHDSVTDPVLPSAETERAAAPIKFTPLQQRQSFHIRASSNELIRQVLTAYGITPSFDSSVKNKQVRLDADDLDFAGAERMLNLLTNTFFVPLDPKRALVAADTKEKRAEFERLSVETLYLPGLTQTETTDMVNLAKNVFDAQVATASPSHSTLTLRAPASKLAALNSTFAEMLDGRSEVQLDVKLYNVAKTRTLNVGLQLPQQSSVFNIPSELNSVLSSNQSLVQQIISSGLANPNDYEAIAAILIASGQVTGSVLNQPFAYFGNGLTLTGITPGTVTGNLALNSSDSRGLDEITMRVLDQEDTTFKSGTRYPIITSTYSSLSGTSLSIPGISSAGISSTLAGLGISASSLASSTSQVIPQVQYEDLGLTLKVKPNVQKDRDVTLNLDLKIESLQGSSINNIPVLDNQQYTAIITLKQGASALVVSNLTKQQSAAVSGTPGLAELPGFNSTLSNQDAQDDVSTLIIMITPHVVRLAHTQDAGRMILLPLHPE